jgi:hypothetical protein
MAAEHNEFPPLEYAAKRISESARILESADLREKNLNGATWLRSFAADVIREAQRQACTLYPRHPDAALLRLEAIADNLHALPPPLPPPPPTREEMEIALADLLRRTDDPAGCHEDNPIAEFANILRRGIAHYCSPTP